MPLSSPRLCSASLNAGDGGTWRLARSNSLPVMVRGGYGLSSAPRAPLSRVSVELRGLVRGMVSVKDTDVLGTVADALLLRDRPVKVSSCCDGVLNVGTAPSDLRRVLALAAAASMALRPPGGARTAPWT